MCCVEDTPANRAALHSVPITAKAAESVFGLEHAQSLSEPGSLQRTRNGKVSVVQCRALVIQFECAGEGMEEQNYSVARQQERADSR